MNSPPRVDGDTPRHGPTPSPLDLHVALAVTSWANGGGEQYVRSIYTNGRAMGLRATLIGSMPGWREEGLSHVPINASDKWSTRNHGVRAAALRAGPERRRHLAAIRGLAQETPIDIVHLQYKREQVLLTRQAKKVAPVVWSELGTFPRPGGILGFGLTKAYRRAAQDVDVIVCVSPAVRQDIAKVLAPRPPILTVIENGVDLERFRPADDAERARGRELFNLPPNNPVVLALSRLIGWKQMDLLVRLAPTLPEITFVIAGDGPERARLESLASHNVRLLGHVHDVGGLVRTADCAVICSEPNREGLPGVMLEYAATGLPIVALRGCVPTIYLEASGAIVADASDNLRIAILTALKAGCNQTGLHWAARHDISKSVAEYIDLFSSLRRRT